MSSLYGIVAILSFSVGNLKWELLAGYHESDGIECPVSTDHNLIIGLYTISLGPKISPEDIRHCNSCHGLVVGNFGLSYQCCNGDTVRPNIK